MKRFEISQIVTAHGKNIPWRSSISRLSQLGVPRYGHPTLAINNWFPTGVDHNTFVCCHYLMISRLVESRTDASTYNKYSSWNSHFPLQPPFSTGNQRTSHKKLISITRGVHPWGQAGAVVPTRLLLWGQRPLLWGQRAINKCDIRRTNLGMKL